MNKPFLPATSLAASTTNVPLATAEPLSINSERLLGKQGLAIIIHQGERYQLRQTKAGKLILTK